ncbi:MAG TPA: hypothetical protein VFB13_06040 [Reyranella sp.]|nr:hypothetical protein [Reyranella sp.]
MNWRLWTWKEITGSAIVAVLAIGLCLYGFASSPKWHNWGFGADWQCRPQPKGDPICFRKLPAKP